MWAPMAPARIKSWPPTDVTLTCTDRAGQSSSCSARVTVVDHTLPAISCPASQVAECVSGGATVNTGAASATDNCSGVSVDNPAPARYLLGVSTVRFTATDSSGNSASCNSTVTVADTQGP